MNEADPLRAPKRDRPQRPDEARGDGAALGLIVALGLCVLGAIFYVHRHPVGEGAEGTAMAAAEASAEGGPGATPAGDGMRKPMREAPLEKAKPIARDTFAAPVTHVTETDACRSLRRAADRIRDDMRKPHSQWEAADFKRELDTITSQGTERGCWSGGAG